MINWVWDEEVGLHSWWCRQARWQIQKKPICLGTAVVVVKCTVEKGCIVFWNVEEKVPMEHSNGDISLEVLGKELRFTSH